MPPVITVIIQK